MPARHVAQALAMALLADARTRPSARTWPALASRARHCMSAGADGLPAALAEPLRRLARLPDREWQRLEVEDLATWLLHGRWRRQAGLPAFAGGAEHMAESIEFGDGDDPDGQDLDTDGETGAPPARLAPGAQSTAQLAAAFTAWASQPTTQARHWLLRPAQAGPRPNWLDACTQGSRASPRWATATDLADALGLTVDQLLWLAPAHTAWRERPGHALPPSHYRYRLLPKRHGGLRLLEIARPQLAQAQRQLLASALNPVPAHEAAHGFVRGRSVASHVAVHAGQAVVARFDLRDFFTQVHATRVRALWRALGHTRAVAELLTGLTTTRTPAAVRERLLCATPTDTDAEAPRVPAQHRAREQALTRPHLAQGAPTSPAIANLCAFGMDVRLAALASRFGARYSRYADDMVFSGSADLHRQWPALRAWVGAIVQDEGFALHADKTRLMPAHQRQWVTGLVVNETPNLPREQYDALKARLHRLARQAEVPAGERARLRGQLQWARQWLAPTRVAKLEALWAAIRFTD